MADTGSRLAPSTNASSQTYLLFLGTLLFVSMTGNVLHHRLADPHNVHTHAMRQFERNHLGGLQKEKHEEKKNHKWRQEKQKVEEWQEKQKQTRGGGAGATEGKAETKGASRKDSARQRQQPPQEGGIPHWQEQPVHDLAGLNCADHGGPAAADVAEEMVYWRDVPSDALFKSPIGNSDGGKKYLTFEPDGGGFNNIRMAMETIVVMAHAMGRTLVMPPSQGMYLLRKDRDKQRVHFSFDDFYHMEQVGYEHAGLDIISMEDFLKAEAMTGHLRNKTNGMVTLPPQNRTNWDGMDPRSLKEYLRDVTLTPLNWKPEQCLAAFPSDDGPEHFDELNDMLNEIKKDKTSRRWQKYTGKPTAVDAAPLERMKEALSGVSNKLCIYDKEMQEAPVVHFMCYHKMRVRMLTHFYGFLFFEDWRHDLWSKRFVRDHLRYSDEIQCAAARIVAAVRDRARRNVAIPHSNPEGLFDSFHIRRGDFQYKATRLEAGQIYNNTIGMISEKATVFVATDHAGKPWFKPLADHYDMVFLNDFKEELKGVNSNYFGMIDQLVASRGQTFFGCYHSTFSGFIFRMRGYHSQKEQTGGWEQGKLQNSFYYTGDKFERNLYTQYTAVHSAIYSREYPISWREIDKGIEEL